MKPGSLRVIKLGGSLLESPDWAQRFQNWIDALPLGRNLLLVGGGPPVDAIRHLATLHTYDAEFLHWLCIDAMEISCRLVQQQLTYPSLSSMKELQSWLQSSETAHGLVHINAFYSVDNYQQLPVVLPLSWDTTSDSLAALLAHVVAADELILVKSCLIDEPYDWQALAQAGVVDAAFSNAIGGLRKVRVASVR